MIPQIARDGDESQLDKLDSEYIANHLNELDEKKLTPLHYAARNESYCLIASNVFLQFPSLFFRYSHLSMVKRLIKIHKDIHKDNKGPLVDVPGDDDMTPLHYAARWDHRSDCSK